MLYLEADETTQCPVCSRRWYDLGGVREPVERLDIDLEAHAGDADGPCLSCDGDW